MKKIALLALLTALGLVLGCKSGAGVAQQRTQTPEDSVRAAIQDHLAHDSNLNLQAFDTDVKKVTIQGDQAQAEVEFRLKNGPGAMQLNYALQKRDGAWSVVDSDAAGSHSAHPGVNQSQGEDSSLPGTSHSLADTLRSFGAEAPSATH